MLNIISVGALVIGLLVPALAGDVYFDGYYRSKEPMSHRITLLRALAWLFSDIRPPTPSEPSRRIPPL